MKLDVVDMKKKKVGELEVAEALATARPKTPLLYENIKQLMANKRTGTASTRCASNVSGSNKKIYRQKGTGNARHGTMKRNIFVGGGVAFGPHPRDYRYSLPKQVRRLGLRAGLSQKIQEGKILLVDALAFPRIKTKEAAAVLTALGITRGVIVVARDEKTESLIKSLRNVEGISVVSAPNLNLLDLFRHDHVVMTQQAFADVQARVLQ